MTVQEVRSALSSVRVKYREFMLAEEKADHFRESLSLSAPVISSDAPKSEHGGNSTENKYIAAMWYSQEAEKKFRLYLLARQEAETLINSVKFPDEKEVLTRRYILFQKWEDIAEKMHYSRQHVTRIHGNALTHLCA